MNKKKAIKDDKEKKIYLINSTCVFSIHFSSVPNYVQA